MCKSLVRRDMYIWNKIHTLNTSHVADAVKRKRVKGLSKSTNMSKETYGRDLFVWEEIYTQIISDVADDVKRKRVKGLSKSTKNIKRDLQKRPIYVEKDLYANYQWRGRWCEAQAR